MITNSATQAAGLLVRRACARVLDASIGLLLVYGIMWLPGALILSSRTDGDLTGLVIFVMLLGPIVYLAYEVPLVACTGQTLGKWLLGVRVRRWTAAAWAGDARCCAACCPPSWCWCPHRRCGCRCRTCGRCSLGIILACTIAWPALR